MSLHSALPGELCVHICSFLCLASVLKLRVACRSLNDMFLTHIDSTSDIWGPMATYAKLMWTTPTVIEKLANNLTFLELARLFRPSQALPSLASESLQW